MRIKLPRKNHHLALIMILVLGVLSPAASMMALGDALHAENKSPDHAVFWALEKSGSPVGYLLGTIHSEDPRLLDFSKSFLDRLKENQVFAMELVPDLPTLTRLTRYMRLAPGRTLESILGQQRFVALEAALSDYHISGDFINHMKPWSVMMTLSTPPPKTGFFMDLSLSLRATGSGLKVIGLETLEQQLSFLEDMPLKMQLELLDQAVAEAAQVIPAHDRMVSAYLENDLQKLQSLADQEFQSAGKPARDYFYQFGINARNQRMVAALLSQFASQRIFIAVGALHLPGEEGLINLLRQAGFELIPLGMPFNGE